jgi:DNA-binding LacI/PurR family transcriptional regulator
MRAPGNGLSKLRAIYFVTHGRTLQYEPQAWVDTDNERAMRLAGVD